MPSATVPDIVVGRLPIYLRALSLMAAEGREITSSQELGERLGISSAQIRKDLSHFGEFGKQGTGYNVAYLREQLRRILKVDREWEVALIGAGALGHALAHYGGFRNRGFHISLIFDSDPAKVGRVLGGIEVLDAAKMEEVIRRRRVRIAMIAVPAEAAQEVADRCVKAGVQAILNYAPINIAVPEGVRVEYIDPVIHLQHMTYYLD
ncbi:MAG TPA: redox-sensing transcriptional repressor Rex [Chloroflexi bacterium]|nr:redox-sensing transcriptional repressor Rex [Chloroflexota bacterium]